MEDTAYFSHLYEIASHLNKEFTLPSALRMSLEKTVDLLDLRTGWIWLVQPDSQSVYLAASYNLPKALSNHPERLSGWCYCIKRYLSDDIEEATNISEIVCTRLKDVTTGTDDLLFHATIPIMINGEKAGLMNLLSKTSQQLSQKQLAILNTISELIGMAIQRTRLQQSSQRTSDNSNEKINGIMSRILQPRVDALISNLLKVKTEFEPKTVSNGIIKDTLTELNGLKEQLNLLFNASAEESDLKEEQEFHYPTSPLTKRELEVLELVKNGMTNQEIATTLYITIRTVKYHISSILSKLYAKTRTEAVNTAFKRGLLSM